MPTDRFSPAVAGRNRRIALIVAASVAATVVAVICLLMVPMFNGTAPRPDAAREAPTVRTGDSQAVLALPAEALSPLNLRALSAEDARTYNLSIPIARLANPPARPFNFVGAEIDFASATDCLASALYYEARHEPLDGQRAVAQVVLNRLRHPQYPKTVCGVVFQGSERATGCQFTFTCDGALASPAAQAAFVQMRVLAEQALRGAVYAPVGGATHYHANYVVPYWADSLTKVQNIGQHIFYRWPNGAGLPSAFTGLHAGTELLPATLSASLTRAGLARLTPEADVPIEIVVDGLTLPEPSSLPLAAPVAPAPMAPVNVAQRADPLPAPTPAAAPRAPDRPRVEQPAAPPVNRRAPFSSSW